MKRTKVTIEKETKKAYLIKDAAGSLGWIQKRWLAADSTVSAKTFERAAADYTERQIAYKEGKIWNDSYHTIITIAKETEKAIAVNVTLDFCDAERNQNKLMWIPKSLVKENGVPGWFIMRKLQDILSEYRQDFSRYGSVIIGSIDIEDCEHLYRL